MIQTESEKEVLKRQSNMETMDDDGANIFEGAGKQSAAARKWKRLSWNNGSTNNRRCLLHTRHVPSSGFHLAPRDAEKMAKVYHQQFLWEQDHL